MKTPAGIEATGVEQRNGVLVFSGEYFLDEQGLPTPKAPPYLTCLNTAHTLSEKYHGRLKRKREASASRFQQRLLSALQPA